MRRASLYASRVIPFALLLTGAQAARGAEVPRLAAPALVVGVVNQAPPGAPLGIAAYSKATIKATVTLGPTNEAMVRATEAFRRAAPTNLAKAEKAFSAAYVTFGRAYLTAGRALRRIVPPTGLREYHRILTGGALELGAASLAAGEGLRKGDEAKFRAAAERITALQVSFERDMRAALASSGYEDDGTGNLVKKRAPAQARTGPVGTARARAPRKAEPADEQFEIDAYNMALEDAQRAVSNAQKEMQALQTEAQSGTADPAVLKDKLASMLKKAGAATRSSVKELVKIIPPAGLRIVHEDIVTGNRAVGRAMIKAGESMGGPDEESAMESLRTVAQRMTVRLMEHLDEAGYEVGLDGKIEKKKKKKKT